MHLNEVNGHMVEGESPTTPKLGMLAWRLLLHSPEFPEGRSVVLIANDVTHQAGANLVGWVRRGTNTVGLGW